MNYATDSLRLIRSEIAVLVLMAEDGDIEFPEGAQEELTRIEDYLARIRRAVLGPADSQEEIA